MKKERSYSDLKALNGSNEILLLQGGNGILNEINDDHYLRVKTISGENKKLPDSRTKKSQEFQPGIFKNKASQDVISSIKSKDGYGGFVSVEDEESGYGSFLAGESSPTKSTKPTQ